MSWRESYPARFARVVWDDWLAKMSGIASVILAAVGAFVPEAVPPWVFWATAILCLVIASYRAWLKECKGREAEVSELRQRLTAKERELADPAYRRRIDGLVELIERGEAFRQWMMEPTDSEPFQELVVGLGPWDTKAKEFLKNQLPVEFKSYLDDFPYPPMDNRGLVASFLDRKLRSLRSILDHVRGQA